MTEKIRHFFLIAEKIYIWLRCPLPVPKYFPVTTRGFGILIILWAVWFFLGRLIPTFSFDFLATHVLFILIIAVYSFISKKSKKDKDKCILAQFNHKAYLYGMTIVSMLFAWCLVIVATMVSNNISFIDLNLKVIIISYFFSASLFSFLWFLFHLVFATTSEQIIKSRGAFYLAILSTITYTLSFFPVFDFILKIFIGILVVSFMWFYYFVEKIQCEKEH